MNTIYIKNRRSQPVPYHYYETYDTYTDALREAKRKQKKSTTKYFIHITEEGFMFPKKRYKLYFNKIMRLTWT